MSSLVALICALVGFFVVFFMKWKGQKALKIRNSLGVHSPLLVIVIVTKIDIIDVQASLARRTPRTDVLEVIEVSSNAIVVIFGAHADPPVDLSFRGLPAASDVGGLLHVPMEARADSSTVESDPQLPVRLLHVPLPGVAPRDTLLCDAPYQLYRLEAGTVRRRPYDLPPTVATFTFHFRIEGFWLVIFQPVNRCAVEFIFCYRII